MKHTKITNWQNKNISNINNKQNINIQQANEYVIKYEQV